MTKFISTVASVCSVLTFFSCNNSETGKEQITKSDSISKVTEATPSGNNPTNGRSMINLAADTNVTIAHTEFPMPNDSWKKAKPTIKNVIVDFGSPVNVKVELSVTFLSLDTANSMVQSCTFKALKRNPNYDLSAAFSEQFNQGTNTIYSFMYADVYATLKKRKYNGQDMVGKHFIIDSKPQAITPTE